MYEQHFGLTGRPFQLTPDPAFWYETATHRRAMAYLGYGLAQGEGFIVITGDIGAGKTTLVGHLLDTLDRDAINPVHLVSTAIEPADLLRIVAAQLGVDTAGLEKAPLLVAIERGLHGVARTGRRTLLIVDEAQALPTAALEELRMLSNFQAGGHALLQIVLLGQPEFRDALHGHDRLEQLRQRVIAIHHLDSMGADEVAAYVRHRLALVGWQDRPHLADGAFAALHRHSDGVPRRLNQLAHRVLLHAAVDGHEAVTAATVELVASDLAADLPMRGIAAPVAAAVPAAVAETPDAEEAPVPTADARPFRHSWLVDHAASPSPMPDVAAATAAAAEVQAEAAQIVGEAAAAPATNDDRLAALEARIEEQDAALRRVLTLLVDWVEAGEAAPAAADYAAIRGTAA